MVGELIHQEATNTEKQLYLQSLLMLLNEKFISMNNHANEIRGELETLE